MLNRLTMQSQNPYAEQSGGAPALHRLGVLLLVGLFLGLRAGAIRAWSAASGCRDASAQLVQDKAGR